MQAQKLPARRGLAWIQEGFGLWKKNPALMTMLSFGYLLSIVLISVVPLVGQPAATLLMPALSLGVLNGARAIARGDKGGPDLLFSGFRQQVPALVTVGGIYLVGSLVALFSTALGDGGTLLAAMTGQEVEAEKLANTDGLLLAILIGTLISTPVMMAYWFAPMLVSWHGIAAPRAMIYSLLACMLNWKPFLLYSLGLLVVAGILPGLVVGILGLLSPTLAALASVPLPLIMVPIVFASFYPNVRDIFGEPPATAPQAADVKGNG